MLIRVKDYKKTTTNICRNICTYTHTNRKHSKNTHVNHTKRFQEEQNKFITTKIKMQLLYKKNEIRIL